MHSTHLALTFMLASAAACGNTVPSGANNNNDNNGGGDYPPGPYGVNVNRVIQNFTFAGYLALDGTVVANSLTYSEDLDLQGFRNLELGDGTLCRYLLLDISAGWCPPCNQEADDLGLGGAKGTAVKEWVQKGGIFMTVLEEGYDQSSESAPVKADLETWINTHGALSTTAFDADQSLVAQGISPSAFPTNLVIELATMKIVSAWYGLEPDYLKWEAALAN